MCAARPEICTKIYEPVCGCDGETYSNDCEAAAAGVAVESTGACAPTGGPFCGGIAGIPCPGSGECVDDPSDSCDPANGGADCGGLCRCETTEPCPAGTHFDASAAVCSCVPDTTSPCAAVLCQTGTECVVVDGKPVCQPPSTGVKCGARTCAEGQVCCNASCGICTAPGQVCIQIACNGTN